MLAMERDVVALTDRLAGAMIAQMTTKALEDPLLRDEGKQMSRSQPQRMKNVGIRSVTIQPVRGEAFAVKTTYYHRKKKGSTPS
ncbi:MAG: hypothetical protein A2487_15785 [Candidatus Raymondbacteria bacterium RifOxyC12_full_50_8]|uniref:Uncharacterized protein n=1 Tax=Candidatus Raymondbacteria bacterium RIFOXYD12_FULL_49_13 TaxID=1817890 RepID=A0A1F7F0X9_UNCRA|nr:MAG: hypothetical protein A2248_01750 [Candidatus Raymondbacteria bacterium RIFOXYA2_FULL_49_16]OGJ95431.1 MAG: hypothetical protein A2487_15785 [Candidatus Raymondbacteria bacterium RifOxyC12_full_50_8]OGK00314.1 MAG: hypothetical protein A2519_10990 [Candidatus Raymondbacteria bacterium RIFOXYD12_FULL_49_13]OGK00645.1 MAG: hypothetical protein A2350_10425 [Candidatus Raymondbacteria bacterium RifOxyB12_full_50_8]OGP45100.1 MAG: hypothetical protein A2324_13045 [Candidatus Raymondbacteria b